MSVADCLVVSAACTTYRVKYGDTCYHISEANGVSLEDFLSWNPGINCNNLQIGQEVCISTTSQWPPSPPAGSCTIYTLKSGDTCYDISQENGVSLKDFLSWNSGINFNNLQIGQEVCISAPSQSPPSPPTGSCTIYTVKSRDTCKWSLTGRCTIYTVKTGDTCYDISQANGVSLEDFLSWNPRINCNNLQTGQEVCISQPRESPPSPPSGPPPIGSCIVYSVKTGDSCYDISQASGISLEEFLRWNPGIDCDNLQVGQEVCISEPPESPPPSANYNGNDFSEYIGALFNGVRFTDLPINRDVDFHFILGFAIDYTCSGSPTNGVFDIYWQKSVLTPEAVQAIKSQYSNVKVMVSLGGDTINGLPVRFSASSVDSWVANAHLDFGNSWVANAVSSFTSMISLYHLDFGSASTHTFVSCMGQLIQQLKSAGVISIASIAPFDLAETQYRALWNQYNDIIDLVNFQFYSYSTGTSAPQFITYYNTAAAKYGGGAKVLPSFSTGGQLKSEGRLRGIMIFSADGSHAMSSFRYEEQAQALLTANATDNSHASM
ncbi:hypothetical protein KP509_14G065800 [Ceratopteris richardii]|uniref:Chitinase n=1 Tax=Ceratopteris richardii TaxID=49495 RepID=A0A8T2TCQ2_CERRI|nr:hypothetical protein KP509_14G065800 [Ceratopteris richardii]